MSKLIKLSDSVGYSLAKRAEEDGLTMAAEVAKLLAVSETPPHPTDTSYFDKRFDELKSLIEDHLVDALASSSISGSKQTPGVPKFLKWGNVQYIMFELLEDDGAPEWIVSESMLDRIKNDTYLDSATFTVKDDVVYINDSPLIRVTPRVREAIDEERVCE